jgi:hypothetical protein
MKIAHSCLPVPKVLTFVRVGKGAHCYSVPPRLHGHLTSDVRTNAYLFLLEESGVSNLSSLVAPSCQFKIPLLRWMDTHEEDEDLDLFRLDKHTLRSPTQSQRARVSEHRNLIRATQSCVSMGGMGRF